MGSPVWEHFTKNPEKDRATCVHCGRSYKLTGGTTSTLIHHLEAKHRGMLTLRPSSDQPSTSPAQPGGEAATKKLRAKRRRLQNSSEDSTDEETSSSSDTSTPSVSDLDTPSTDLQNTPSTVPDREEALTSTDPGNDLQNIPCSFPRNDPQNTPSTASNPKNGPSFPSTSRNDPQNTPSTAFNPKNGPSFPSTSRNDPQNTPSTASNPKNGPSFPSTSRNNPQNTPSTASNPKSGPSFPSTSRNDPQNTPSTASNPKKGPSFPSTSRNDPQNTPSTASNPKNGPSFPSTSRNDLQNTPSTASNPQNGPSLPSSTAPRNDPEDTPKSTNPKQTLFSRSVDRFMARVVLAIAIFIAVDMVPVSVVQGAGFAAMMRVMLGESFNVPSQGVVTNHLKQLKNQGIEFVRESLRAIEFLNISIEGWTSLIALNAFLTATVYGLNDSWEIVAFTLFTCEFHDTHTAMSISNKLVEKLAEFNIQDKILSTTHHDSAQITFAVNKSEKLGESNHCFAHTQNLCVLAILDYEPVKKLFKKCSKLFEGFKFSTEASKDDKAAVDKETSIQYCKTRWHSYYEMLQCLVKKKSLGYAIVYNKNYAKKKKSTQFIFNDSEWDMINSLIEILEPFAEILESLCEDQVTISFVRPSVFYLLEHLKPDLNDCNFKKEVKAILAEQISNRFKITTENHQTSESKIEILANKNGDVKSDEVNSLDDSFDSDSDSDYEDYESDSELESQNEPSVAQIASFLDPRFKKLRFESEDDQFNIETHVKSLFNKVNVEKNIEEQPAKRKINVGSSWLLNRIAVSLGCHRSPKSEFERYVDQEECSADEDPLLWWKNHELRFPRMAKLAKRYLAIPATLEYSKRVVSNAAINVDVPVKRISLMPENVDMLVFLNKNPCTLKQLYNLNSKVPKI